MGLAATRGPEEPPLRRPLIGVTTYREPASWGAWQQVRADLVPADYTDAVRAAGGTVVLIPPLGPADRADEILSRLDGLVVAGGADVNPTRYGDLPLPTTTTWRDDRDVSELALLDAAADLDLPVLGVCRGLQMMAVHAGGTLHQHVPDRVGHQGHSPGPDSYGPIDVTTVPGTRLAALLGDRLTVPCHHHQTVATAPGLVVSAHAADGEIEGLELPGERFALGIQWHPETHTDRRLFQGLIAAATR